ncbi:Gfo/Idh/MocA family protein [Humisphaera borealis]|uniref:Gfo/Idh/MocA family oxidoreductase n=1 Tax=Humisphaera borealis TaxID=2807512 RepID=A0A7M2WVH9_9BACT|nr:Gfo/Idh/MocA family oxidoreductase [Humisphaera borealis]QOV88841.1 Gfo/Idh/MocA family oxidoreductase [Humisphaera borealis]
MPTPPLSRRQFLSTSAAAAAVTAVGPSIVPSSVFGDAKAAAPSERLTLGFIGMGKQNGGHLSRMLGKRETQVLAVCDVDTTRREDARLKSVKKYDELKRAGGNSVTPYVDYHELLARKDIDAVVIALPDHWHAAVYIDAAKAKKHIYGEKPLTLTINEAKACIDAVRKHKVVFQTGSQQRSSNEFRKAIEYVRSGRIGKIKRVLVDVGGPSKPCDLKEEPMEPGLDWERWLGPAPLRPYNSVLSPRGVHNHFPAWRSYREYSGGGLTDFGAHHFDIAQWGLGMDRSGPVEIIPPDDVSKGKGVKFVYANGIEMIHQTCGFIIFEGESGKIMVNRGKLQSDPESILLDPLTDKDWRLPKTPGHHENWMECIKTGALPECDIEIGARSVTICHLANLAYWNKQKMKWDPQAWKFVDGQGDNAWLGRDRRGPYTLPEA